jgi:hypothetical protein
MKLLPNSEETIITIHCIIPHLLLDLLCSVPPSMPQVPLPAFGLIYEGAIDQLR